MLWKQLQDGGITNFDFVGSQNGPTTCNIPGADLDNEGHSGAKATEYASNGKLVGWLQNTKPGMILVHVGTNDAVARTNTSEIIKAYDTLLGQMRASNPNMVIVVCSYSSFPISHVAFRSTESRDFVRCVSN